MANNDYYWSGAFDCKDCGIHTGEAHEYYMVNNDLWKQHGTEQGMLCIGCLENRMQRQLTADDFTDCALNNGIYGQSPRLQQRLGHP